MLIISALTPWCGWSPSTKAVNKESCVSKHWPNPVPSSKWDLNLVETVNVIHFYSVSKTNCHVLITLVSALLYSLWLTWRTMDSFHQPRLWNAELGLCPVDSGLGGSSCPLYAEYLRCWWVKEKTWFPADAPFYQYPSVNWSWCQDLPSVTSHFLAMPDSEKACSTNWSQTVHQLFTLPTPNH